MSPTQILERLLGYARRGKRLLFKIGAVWLAAFTLLTVFPFGDPSRIRNLSGIFDSNWLDHSVAAGAFRLLESYLLPRGETLIATGPFDAFMTVMYVGAGLALLVALPYATYLLFRILRLEEKDPLTGVTYVGSVLTDLQRSRLRTFGTLAILFFLLGVAFGLLLLPPLYGFAYQFQVSAGVSGTITLSGFLGTTAFVTLGLGAFFEIPTVAYGLAVVGVLKSSVLRSQWQIAALVSVGMAFVVSPGITGGLLEIPIAGLLFGLYGLAYSIVRGVERRRIAEGVAIAGAIEDVR